MLAHMEMEIDNYNQTKSLAEWAKVKKELAEGTISLEEYEEWKTNWPDTSKIYSDSPKQWKRDK